MYIHNVEYDMNKINSVGVDKEYIIQIMENSKLVSDIMTYAHIFHAISEWQELFKQQHNVIVDKTTAWDLVKFTCIIDNIIENDKPFIKTINIDLEYVHYLDYFINKENV